MKFSLSFNNFQKLSTKQREEYFFFKTKDQGHVTSFVVSGITMILIIIVSFLLVLIPESTNNYNISFFLFIATINFFLILLILFKLIQNEISFLKWLNDII